MSEYTVTPSRDKTYVASCCPSMPFVNRACLAFCRLTDMQLFIRHRYPRRLCAQSRPKGIKRAAPSGVRIYPATRSPTVLFAVLPFTSCSFFRIPHTMSDEPSRCEKYYSLRENHPDILLPDVWARVSTDSSLDTVHGQWCQLLRIIFGSLMSKKRIILLH